MDKIRVIYWKTFISGLIILILLIGCCLFLVIKAWNTVQNYPQLSKNSPLAVALDWPWKDFPESSNLERNLISEFQVKKKAAIYGQILPWKDVFIDREFAFKGKEQKNLESAIQALKKLISEEKNSTQIKNELIFQKIHQDFTSLIRKSRNNKQKWIPLYNQGILYLYHDRFSSAIEDLQNGLNLLLKLLKSDPNEQSLYEPLIVNYYALGHAYYATKSKDRAIAHFRRSIHYIGKLVHSQYSSQKQLDFFLLKGTDISTRSVWNDLIATYLTYPEYQNCKKAPLKEPDCNELYRKNKSELEGFCEYRDKLLCEGYKKVLGTPFQDVYYKIFRQFYNDKQIEKEYCLWALSNLADLYSINIDLLNDPYILYNAISLLIELEEYGTAAKLLKDAPEVVQEKGDADIIIDLNKLKIIIKISLNDKPVWPSCDLVNKGTKTPIRRIYDKLYSDITDMPVQPFPRVGKCFDIQEPILDQWLFIRLWKAWLRKGNYEKFIQEFDKALKIIKEEQLFKYAGKYEKWYDELYDNIAMRGFDKYEYYKNQGDAESAGLIQDFIVKSGHFDNIEMINKFNPQDYYIKYSNRYIIILILISLLLFVLTAYFVFFVGSLRAFNKTFLSFHRATRLQSTPKDTYTVKGNPYTFGNPVIDKDFYGRTQELSWILLNISNQSFLLDSEWRTGKTSLLYQIRHVLERQESKDYYYIPIYLSVNECPEQDIWFKMAEKFVEAVSRHKQFELNNEKDMLLVEPGQYGLRQLKSLILELAEKISKKLEEKSEYKQKIKFIIEIDEAQQINTYTGEARADLRTLFSQSLTIKEYLSAIVAGYQIRELKGGISSPWVNFMSVVDLTEGLTDTDFHSLIKDPIKNSHYSFNNSAIQRIAKYSKKIPYDTKVFCNLGFEEILKRKEYILTDSVVEQIKDKAFSTISQMTHGVRGVKNE